MRRELERAGKVRGIAALDAWNAAYPDRYLPLSDTALRLGAMLWARSRNAGTATAWRKAPLAEIVNFVVRPVRAVERALVVKYQMEAQH